MANLCKFLALKKSFFLMSGLMVGVFLFGIGTVFAGTTPSITSVKYKEGSDKLLVEFNEPVFGAVDGTGNLATDDFTFTDTDLDGMVSISAISHVAGNKWAVLTMNAVAVEGDAAETLNAKPNSIFTIGGALSEKLVPIAIDAAAPTFTVSYKLASDKLLVDFSEPVWTSDMKSGAFNDASAVTKLDFAYVDNGTNAASLDTAAQHLANDRDKVVLDLNAVLAAGDINAATGDTINVAANGTAIYDIFGNGVATGLKMIGAAGTTSDATAPTISRVEIVKDKIYMLAEFSEPISTADPTTSTVTLLSIGDETDLDYTDTAGTRAIIAAGLAHVAGNPWAVLKFDSAFAVVDLTAASADTLSPKLNSFFDVFGNAAAVATTAANDTTDPVILSATINKTAASGYNTLALEYSEDVTFAAGAPVAGGAAVASTATMGDMTVACTPVGFGAFSDNAGNLTYKTLKNSVALNAAATTFTITLAAQTGGYRTSTAAAAACTDASGDTFTPSASVQDLAAVANVIEATSTLTTHAITAAWDVANPLTTQVTTPTSAATTTATIGWTAQGASNDYREYKFFYGMVATAGASLGGTEWGVGNDEALTTITTTSTILTGLNSGTLYFVTPYIIDTFGNAAAAGTEIGIQTNSGSVSSDRTATAAPTAVKVESKGGKAVLTWVDPTASDLASIVVLRGKNEIPVSGTTYATVAKGLLTYTDNDVAVGETVKYMLRGKDTARNESVNSEMVSVVIVAAAATPETGGTTTPDVITPDTTTTPDAEAVTEDKELTPAQKLIQNKIDKLNKTIARNTKSIEKYTAKIGKLDGTKKADKKKITAYTKSIKNWNRLITRDQATVVKLEARLGQ